jgi:hypothetical protein
VASINFSTFLLNNQIEQLIPELFASIHAQMRSLDSAFRLT